MNIEYDTTEDKEKVKSFLRESVMTIFFTKKDGTERVLKSTLNTSIIPEEFAPKDVQKNKTDEVLSVFDIENNGWRSFRWDSVKQITVGND
jgi:hypothetical protein